MTKKFFLIRLILSSFILIPCLSIADIYQGKAALRAERFQQAKEHFRKSAELGNAESQYLLGSMYIDLKYGPVDKMNAFLWMSLAAKSNYPGALDISASVYAHMSTQDKVLAQSTLSRAVERYGSESLQKTIYPVLLKTANQAPIAKPASMRPAPKGGIRRSARTYNDGVPNCVPPAHKYSVYPSFCYTDRQQIGIASTVITYNLDENGRVEDPEVLFSYPFEYSHSALLYLLYADHKPAQDAFGRNVRQQGLLHFAHSTDRSLRRDRSLKSVAGLSNVNRSILRKLELAQDQSADSKYAYATALRALTNVYNLKDIPGFDKVLFEAASAGHPRAQVDYAEYQIFQKKQIELGMKHLLTAASGGVVHAQYRLGDLLMSPVSPLIERDVAKAKFWLQRAASKSHIAAAGKLAELLLREQSPGSSHKAVAILKSTIGPKNNSVSTIHGLARAYLQLGKHEEARKWLKKAIRLAKQSGLPMDELKSLKYLLNS